MNGITRHIFLLLILLLCQAAIWAQSGFYVPPSARIFFTGDSATIFSNVLNAGKFGIGQPAVVNFKGKHWENSSDALITDESNNGDGVNGTGGWIRFISDSELQTLFAGFNAVTRTGAAFSKLELLNPYGMQLTGSSAKILSELKFSGGLFYLSNNVLVVGNGNPGIINGYGPSRYLVTANQPGNGILLRENITSSDGTVVFPIGSKPNAYTPGAVQSKVSAGDDYYMSVFDSVRSDLTSGVNLQDSTVNKTWEIGKIIRPGIDEADIFLQHLLDDEGSFFQTRRSATYISRYNGQYWDTAMPQTLPVAGYLTTGPPLADAGVNNRTVNGLIGNASFFTKFTGINKPLPVETKVMLNAFRTDWNKVRVYWTTKPEIDQDYFVVQRRLANESEFHNIDTVASKAPNGTSINYLNYLMMDNNSYAGISYYRLLLVNLRNERAYSNMVSVKGKPGEYRLMLWPNPTRGQFFVGISGMAVVKTILITDLLGRKLREEAVGERTVVEMQLYIPGTYLITFIGNSGAILETKKLIVQPY